MSDVKRLARWTGWCDPCQTERPLVLTERGQRGLRAWLRGIGPEDRDLTLTCVVCGGWQEVPHDEEDVTEVLPEAGSPLVAVRPLGIRQLVLRSPLTPYPAEPVPAPRTAPDAAPFDDDAATLELLAAGLDLGSAVAGAR